MDASQFDGLTRWFMHRYSRRLTFGLAFAGLSAALGVAETEAVACKPLCSRCKSCNRTTGKCEPKPNGTACGDGKVCCNGRCRACCRTSDCDPGEICAAGQCVVGRGDCLAEADACKEVTTCAGNLACECFPRLEGGTRCVQFTLAKGACDQCTTDAGCVALGFPPGSSCIRDSGFDCTCNADNRGFCGEPCGFVATTSGVAQSAARGPRR